MNKATLNFLVFETHFFYQYLAAITGTLTTLTGGMHYGWPSPSLPILENSSSSVFTITSNEGSWIAVMTLMGSPLGSFVAAAIVDIIGRKTVVIVSCFPFFGAWLMIAFARNAEMLYVSRFIAGIADGLVFTALPMYMGEISDPRIRGFLGCGICTSYIFGILLINIIGSYLSITTTALVSSAVPILALVTFIWMPESPYFLAMKDQEEEAKKSLQILRGKKDIDSELCRISKAVKAQTQDTKNTNFLDLFVCRSNRKAVYIIAILRGAQQFSGISAITFYNQRIFQELREDVSSEMATTIFFLVQFFLTFICSSISDKAGRKPLLIVSLSGSALALFIEGTYFYLSTQTTIDLTHFTYLPVISLIGFVVFFSFGMQSIPILMMGELFSTNVKAFALFLADIYFSIIATIVSKIFQILKVSFGIYLPFYTFSGSCLLGLVFIVWLVPETKGKNLEEIQELLGGKTGRERTEKNNKTEV